MSITLADIERAIRANFVLAKDGRKILETEYEWESNSLYTARLVFVGIACQLNFPMEQICHHLDMPYKEYVGKVSRYKEHMITGKEKYARILSKELMYDKEVKDMIDLRVYRKTILINNYLATVQHTKIAY
jgi:hypothetical protein